MFAASLQGVGVWGTTMGKAGTSADAHLAAAARAEKALQQQQQQQQQDDAEEEEEQSELINAVIKELPEVSCKSTVCSTWVWM
jgi:membrane protease subunit (stomatin/prohibitin family)